MEREEEMIKNNKKPEKGNLYFYGWIFPLRFHPDYQSRGCSDHANLTCPSPWTYQSTGPVTYVWCGKETVSTLSPTSSLSCTIFHMIRVSFRIHDCICHRGQRTANVLCTSQQKHKQVILWTSPRKRWAKGKVHMENGDPNGAAKLWRNVPQGAQSTSNVPW